MSLCSSGGHSINCTRHLSVNGWALWTSLALHHPHLLWVFSPIPTCYPILCGHVETEPADLWEGLMPTEDLYQHMRAAWFPSEGQVTGTVSGHQSGMKLGSVASSIHSLVLPWKTPLCTGWCLMRRKWSAAHQVSSVVDDSVAFGWKVQKGNVLLGCVWFFCSFHTRHYLCCPSPCQFFCPTGYF